MIYIASPYSHPDPMVRERRFKAVREVVARLILDDHVAFSPIVYSHQFAHSHGTDWDVWREFDTRMIDAASELWVLQLDGWSDSVGVQAEMVHAKKLGKPVRFLDPRTIPNNNGCENMKGTMRCWLVNLSPG
jgi:hypothetical protein